MGSFLSVRRRTTSVAALWLLLLAAPGEAQLQDGAIRGTVVGPDGQPADAAITLLDPLGATLATTRAVGGTFALSHVPLGTFSLRADASPLHATLTQVRVTSAVPLQIQLRLSARSAEQVDVVSADAQPTATTTRVTLGGEAVRRAPARLRSRAVQDAIATTPGWATEDNGLLHVRGVDDGFLYVIDGVPVYERLDGLFGMAPDPAMIDSVNIVAGYIPPEFGWKAGGVLEVRSAARGAERWSGNLEAGGATESTSDVSLVAGGPLGKSGALTVGTARQTSGRFLDPVHPGNLHNDGRAWSGGAQLGWSIAEGSTLTAVGGFGRSGFDVPHGEEQEAAGQDEQQRIGQYSQSLSWQRAWSDRTVSQIAAYARANSSRLDGSERDMPLFVNADRSLRRAGLLASVSHQRGRHLFKAGAELSGLRLREEFAFAVTDEEEGEEAGLSDAARAFSPDSPFHFTGSARPSLASLYVQDSITFAAGISIDAGVRADWSRLGTRAAQVSPRLGAAYQLPATATTVRGSLGRFFQPPQAENLLLASSDAAWALSPFRTDTGGGAALQPERQTQIEVAVNQPIAGALRVDVAWWQRRITNVADPNVFFGTTILFPNAVARGRASGVDVRVEVPRRRGWSGYVSYANSRVLQFGPITGGLFLEDEIIEIGPGTAFTPDHDQRHVAATGVTYDSEPRAFWGSLTARYESGTPLEVEDEDLDELRDRPGAALVDIQRGRVRPRLIFDLIGSKRLIRRGTVEIALRAGVLNLTGRRFAYNFGNPFSGTHFGPGRTAQLGLRVSFR